MHGRPRKSPKPEEAAAAEAKAEKLRSLQSQFLSDHHNKIYTKEALEVSAKLVEINPESYTAWNYRKLAVEHNLREANSDTESFKLILDEELRVVERALRQNFKSYGAWHHRKWVLSKGHSSIDHELQLLDKLQRADPRNFHAWNYRRHVTGLMNISEQDELKYTEDMICNNFSNYSAWHNRSVLLSNMLEKKVEGYSSNDKLLPEFELVHQAIFTDPDDQSGWFYHHWLLDQIVKPESPLLVSSWPAHGSDLIVSGSRCLNGSTSPFNGLHSESGILPLILHFNQAVEGVNSSTVTVECDLKISEDLVWKPLTTNNSQTAKAWVTELNFWKQDLFSFPNTHQVKVILGHSLGIVSPRGFQFSHPSQVVFTVHLQPNESDSGKKLDGEVVLWTNDKFDVYNIESQETSPLLSFGQLNVHEPTDSNWRLEALVEEINCFRELLLLTESKIGKLTLARLLSAHDDMEFSSTKRLIQSEEVLELYQDLMKLDPPHFQYYKDEHSLALLQQVISSKDSLLKNCFLYRGMNHHACLRLNNLSLSRIGHFEKLLWVQMLDLSHNDLHSVEGLEAMQLLSCLNLSYNKFSSFTAMEPLRQLKSLKVLDISYNQIGEHSIDTRRYLCSSPLSHSVESEWHRDETIIDRDVLTKYWETYFMFKGLNLEQLNVMGNAVADENLNSFVVKVMPSLKWLNGQTV